MKNLKFALIALQFIALTALAQPAGDTTETWDSSKSGGGVIEKFGNRLAKKMEEMQAKQNAPVDAKVNASLQLLAQNWSVNNKLVTFSPYHTSGMLKGGRYVYIKMNKNEEGYIDPIHVGFFLNDDKTINDPEVLVPFINPMYSNNKWFFTDGPFVFEYYNGDNSLYITENSIVRYEVVNGKKPDVKDVDWIAGKKGKNEDTWTKEIEAYRRLGFAKKITDQEELAAAEIAFRSTYSLENKTVTDLNVVYVDDSGSSGATVGGNVKFGIEVTLADGTKDKTHNLGGNLYMEDFVTDFGSTYNIDDEYKNDQWGGHCHCENGTLNVSKYSPKPGGKDKITFTVKPKFAGSGSHTLTLPLKYPERIDIMAGGATLDYKIKTIKHSETGEELLYIEGAGGKSYRKLKKNGTFYVSVSGSAGAQGRGGADCHTAYCKGGKAGDGQDGSDAGNVYVVMTAAAEKMVTLSLHAKGGSGGPSGIPGTAWPDTGTNGDLGYRGNDGRDGHASQRVGTVNF